MNIQAIKQIKLTPSERLLREMLAMSTSGEDAMISDLIVIWTDQDGRQHMRSTANEGEPE